MDAINIIGPTTTTPAQSARDADRRLGPSDVQRIRCDAAWGIHRINQALADLSPGSYCVRGGITRERFIGDTCSACRGLRSSSAAVERRSRHYLRTSTSDRDLQWEPWPGTGSRTPWLE